MTYVRLVHKGLNKVFCHQPKRLEVPYVHLVLDCDCREREIGETQAQQQAGRVPAAVLTPWEIQDVDGEVKDGIGGAGVQHGILTCI
jgi:hypothetical protein